MIRLAKGDGRATGNGQEAREAREAGGRRQEGDWLLARGERQQATGKRGRLVGNFLPVAFI
jgi:hypothetical protein